MRFKLLSDSDLQYIVNHYPTLGCRKVAVALGKKSRYIEHVVQELGLKMVPQARRQLLIETLEKPFDAFRVDHRQFLDVKTPEVAYFLGFLWADGNLDMRGGQNTVRISINTTDADNLTSVCKRIGDFRITTSHYTYRNSRTCISTSNKHLCRYLASVGYKAKSCSSACDIIRRIPDCLKHYWFRGLIDGDGCFRHGLTSKYIAISSATCQDWSYVTNLLRSLGVRGYSIRRVDNEKGASSQVRVHNTDDILAVGEYIYNGYPSDAIGLERKWQIFQKIKQFAANRPQRYRQ